MQKSQTSPPAAEFAKAPLPSLITVTTLLTFWLVRFGTDLLYPPIGIDPKTKWTLWAYTAHVSTWYVLLPVAVLMGLHGFSQGWRQLGWQANLKQGVYIAFLMSLPMLIGFISLFELVDLSRRQIWVNLYVGALWAGVSEETFFRAFILGQLYRYGRWPFGLAVLLQAVLFGVSHLHQAHDIGQAVSIFTVTALGAAWFGWLWLAWRNLWVPIFLHALMNAWWLLFTTDPTAVGSWVSNGCRALTIGVSIWLTLRELGKQGRNWMIWREGA